MMNDEHVRVVYAKSTPLSLQDSVSCIQFGILCGLILSFVVDISKELNFCLILEERPINLKHVRLEQGSLADLGLGFKREI